MGARDPLIRRNVQLRRAAYRELRKQAASLGMSVAQLVRALAAAWLAKTARGRKDWDRGIPRIEDLARQLRRRR